MELLQLILYRFDWITKRHYSSININTIQEHVNYSQNEYDDTIQKHESAHINTILSHKEKSVYFAKKMDEVSAMNKIEVDLSQEKIDFTNDMYQKELQIWKKVALESVSKQRVKQNN